MAQRRLSRDDLAERDANDPLAPLRGEFQVNSFTTDSQRNPAVAIDGQGNFVVVWEGYGSSASDTGWTRMSTGSGAGCVSCTTCFT